MVPHARVGRVTWGLLQNGSERGTERLLEFSTLSVLIAALALLIMGAVGFAVFLFGVVRLIARQ